MPSEMLSFLACFSVVLFLVPTVICVVLVARMAGLRDRLAALESRVAELTRELFARPRPAARPVAQTGPQGAAEAMPRSGEGPVGAHGAPIPLTPERTDWPGQEKSPEHGVEHPRVVPPAQPAAHPGQQAAAPVPPKPASPVAPVRPVPQAPAAAHGTAGRLLGKLEELRQREKQEAAGAAGAVPGAAAHPPAGRAPAAHPPVTHVPAAHAPAPSPGAHEALPRQPVRPAVPASAAGPATKATGAAHERPKPVMQPAAAPERKKRSLEFYIIGSFIVIGAITLALAAIFLVKMGIERGVFGPAQRDWAGLIGSLALLGVGQWWRKREGFWSQGLIGAGIVGLFAVVYAATKLHGFLLPLHGFVLLALATAGAVAMSLQDWTGGTEGARAEGEKRPARGGMLIAGLGLIGGFITPILMQTGRDDVAGLFGYLILLHLGLVFATRIRGWTILAAGSVVLSSLWLIMWTLFKYHPAVGVHDDGPILGLFMLGMVGSLVLSTVTQPEKWRGGRGGLASMVLTWTGVGLGMLSACLLIGKSHYDDFQWLFFAVLVLGAFVLARLRPVYEAMAWLASAAVLALLTVWGVGILGIVPGVELTAGVDVLREHARFQGWLMGFGVVTVAGAYACLWKSAAPVRWALLVNILALGYVGVAYWLLPAAGAARAETWGWMPVAVAAVLAGLMAPCVMLRQRMATGEGVLTVFGHGILGLLLLAAPMGLHGGAWTAAWAALLPVVALAIWRLRLPGMVGGFLLTVVLVSIRALMLGTVFDAGGAGRSLWWNPVVWSYGVMVLSMGASAWLLEQCGEPGDRWRGVLPGPRALAAAMHVGATAAAFLLLTLEVRWGFHDGQLDAHSALLAERGTFAIGWLLLAAGIVWFGGQMGRRVLVVCGEVIGVLGLVYAVLGLVVVTNPMWWALEGAADQVRGMPVFNLLLYAYGVPAALCGLLAYVIGRSEPRNDAREALARVAAVAGVILLFALVGLQVRQGFGGPQMGYAGMTFREVATYGVAWLGLGTVCLAIGRRFKKEMLWRSGNVICTVGAAFAVVVTGIVMSPVLHAGNVGETKVWNELLYAYGVPAALGALAAWVVDARAARILGPLPGSEDRAFGGGWRLGDVMRSAVMMLLFILVTTEVRQAFVGGDLHVDGMTFLERSVYPVAWLVLAGMFLSGAYRVGSPVTRRGGKVMAAIGLAFVWGVNVVLLNPLWSGERIGGVVVFNDLLFAYGVPALLCGLLAWLMRRHDREDAGFLQGVGISGLGLLFVLVSLEVRQGFAGEWLRLSAHPVVFTELATYGVIWMSLAAVLLATGMRWGLRLVWKSGAGLAVFGLAYAVAVVGILGNPIAHGWWVGDWRVLNHVLYGYGVPLALCALVAWVVDERAERWFDPAGRSAEVREMVLGNWGLGRVMRAGAVVLAFILTGMEVRQWFQGAYLNLPTMDFMERGSYGVMWFMLAAVLLPIGYGLRSQAGRRGGLIVAAAALFWSLALCGVAMNPLWTHERVGATPIVNGLLYAYGVPALLAGALGVMLWQRRSWVSRAGGVTERAAAWVSGIGSLVLVFVLVTLEVQQFCRGDRLGWGAAPAGSLAGEFVAYSVAWLVLGMIYLVTGIWRRSVILRWASLVMMLITIPKVFLFDMGSLKDMQLVLSLGGLGISLMGLAFVYVRFVFRREAK